MFIQSSHSKPESTENQYAQYDLNDSPPKANIKTKEDFQSPEGQGIQDLFNKISNSRENSPPLASTKRKLEYVEENETKRAAIAGLDPGEREVPVKNIDATEISARETQITPLALQKLNFSKQEDTFLMPSHFLPPQKSYAPPPTPRKSNPKKSLYLPPTPASPYQTLFNKTQLGTLSIQGLDVQLTLLSNKGSYMNVFTVEALSPLIQEQSNDKLVFKTFNAEKSTFSQPLLKKWMRSSLDSYQAIKNLGLPVATIYNADTAIEDCYYLQDKIAGEVDVLNSSHIEQCRIFFITSLQNKDILFDLLPDNLRVNEFVTLIDFVEESEEDDDTWDLFCKHALTKWCTLYREITGANREGTLDFLSKFTQGFDQYGYQLEWNQVIISSVFGSIEY